MKNLLQITIIIAFVSFACGTQPKRPTGTYELGNGTTKKGEDIYGYFGKVQVKELRDNQIALSFYISKGAPGYNSGSFTDTLNINNNTAVYSTSEFGTSCEITFKFSDSGIQVDQKADDLNSSCGFGNGVVANGFFKKTSSEIPVLENMATGEELR